MPNETFLNFAYGSNMFTPRLHKRCPSARAQGIAFLSGHDLRWHKRSTDGSGKCDIVATKDTKRSVFGVLFEIAMGEKPALDRLEGLGVGYEEIDVCLIFEGSETRAKAYRATSTDPSLKPYSWYHALVVAGAKEHGLPDEYAGRIEQVSSWEDPDRERHERNMRLLDGGHA